MFLGIDLGTTNVKVVVVDEKGDVVGRGTAGVNRFLIESGGVEQDINQIWQATCYAIRTAIVKLDASEILAVGVSSQGGSLQLLNAQEQSLGRVISWMDTRGLPHDKQLSEQLGKDFFSKHVGHGESGSAIGQLLRLRRETPEIVSPSSQIAFVGDFIVGRFCGRRAHDASSLAFALLYNPWLDSADPELLDHLGITLEQLPDLLPATSPAGTVTPAAATATGLPPGIPVSPAVHDQYAATLGSGSTEEGSLLLGTGTAWVLLASCASLIDPVTEEAFVSKHVVEGLYGQLLSMGTGGSAIEWAMELFGLGEPTREKVDSVLTSVAAGSEGLHFWPAFTHCSVESNKVGDRLLGTTPNHSPCHFVRSVVEGLSCELARCIRLFSQSGIPIERLNLCGLAATSAVTSQIIANVICKPVRCIHEPAVSSLGAAILARALTLRQQTNLSTLSRLFAPEATAIKPDEDCTLYQALLEEYLGPFSTLTPTK